MGTQAAAQLEADTIVAIATPPGRGGIGVVRLSGPASLAIATAIVTLRAAPSSRHAHYGVILDAEGRRLDDALLTWFAAPASYTGENVVEIGTHGSPVVLRGVVEAALRHGARLARPGEFTERAYLGGKLDLTAAEAVRDLIDAQTLDQARLAAEQLGGSLAREVAPVKQRLVELIAALEAGIDFAEDDLDTLSADQIANRIAPLLPPLQRLEQSFAHGRLLREGLKLAIVGKPNAGKSSLFNRLLGRDRAIVTPVAGTTRDIVSESLLLGGIPIQLLDTAGLRDTADVVERIGVERSHEAIADADLILHLVDATDPDAATAFDAPPGPASPGTSATHGDAGNMLRVLTKIDLQEQSPRLPHAGKAPADHVLRTSSTTGQGIADLQRAIVQNATRYTGNQPHAATLTNLRQHAAVATAVEALQRALRATGSIPHEMLLLDLYQATEALDTLTGTTTPDDILNLIFSTFCIGK